MTDARSNHTDERFESSDLSPRAVIATLATIFLLIVVALIVCRGLFVWTAHRLPADQHGVFGRPRLPPEPRLQSNPREDLAAFRQRESERLSTYGWVDASAGLVHIPVNRAMDLIIRDGLPIAKKETK